MSIDRRNDELRRVLEASQCLVTVKRKLVTKFRRLFRKHVDVGAGAEKFVTCTTQNQDVNAFVEPRLYERFVELLQTIERVCVRGRVGQFDDCDTLLNPVLN